LVHINWIDSNAEISFIINTKLEKKEFHKHWGIYLDLIEQVAFGELKLHKLFTYAFDLRPHLYEAIEAKGYEKEAVLKEHCFFKEYKNVVIHSKINTDISLRKANESDLNTIYEWANDELTRKNSFSSEQIQFENHKIWWYSKMKNTNADYYICEVEGKPAGIVRFDKDNQSEHFIIGITIAPIFRGKGLSDRFLKLSCFEFFKTHNDTVNAYIKKTNVASVKAFEKAGFIYVEDTLLQGIQSVKYQLMKNDN
jgi:RimJ/RimL family protein N-acetyltransferase